MGIGCGLTIHSSRNRFAARLNSGVRPLQKHNLPISKDFAVIERSAKGRMRTFLLATLCCGVTACVTTQNYEETLNLWKGSSEVNLIKSWGAPTDIFNSNGHKFLVYQDAQTTALEPMKNYSSGSHDYLKTLSCTTVFELFDGRVVEWAIKGNNCRQ